MVFSAFIFRRNYIYRNFLEFVSDYYLITFLYILSIQVCSIVFLKLNCASQILTKLTVGATEK